MVKFKKVVIKKLIKPSRTSLKIKEYKAPSVLSDTNRFFKQEMEEAKTLFFS